MNHYKWVVFKIQDLSTSECIHSVRGYSDSYNEDCVSVSVKPIQWFVNSDNAEEILKAKEIMEAYCNSIYEVSVETEDTEIINGEEDYVVKKIPAFLNNTTYYNLTVKDILSAARVEKAKKQKKAKPFTWESAKNFKKLHKNRFQVIQEFAGGLPSEIEEFDDI